MAKVLENEKLILVVRKRCNSIQRTPTEVFMTTENMASEEQTLERPPLAELARKVLLAGIGAVALAQEEAEAFVQKLIEKGEIAEQDGGILMKDLREKRKQRAEEYMDKRISTLIDRMNVPTKADINSLSEKIAEIAKKVDDLKKSG